MRVPVASVKLPAPEKKQRSNGHTVDLATFAGTDKQARKKSQGSRCNARAHAAARANAKEHIESRDWSNARPASIVGLYSLLHERVYGVVPSELDGPTYLTAVSRAKSVCAELTPHGAYELVRWTWKRAEAREKTKKDDDDFRIGWRYQFSSSMITNFKVARARAGKSL